MAAIIDASLNIEPVPRTSKTPSKSFWMFWILVAACVLRVYRLEIKPVHFDEGINGHFVETIWRDGYYRYDPTNFHGPLYFYILALAERVFGFGIFGFRFVTALLQLALIAIVGWHRRFVGNVAIWAALVIALSPAFVFYSRYAIHESLFILAQVAFSYGYFLYREERSSRALWWMALATVGLVTTKETFFIFLGTWAIAAGCVNVFDRVAPRWASHEGPKSGEESAGSTADSGQPLQNWIAIALVAIVLIVALFTGFFLYPRGAVDMVTAFDFWTHTGTAHTGHEKVFTYWLDLLRRFEWPSLIGLVLSPILFFFANRPLRVLLLTGIGTWLAYSLIPYKTPWLILNMLWPLAFAAGAVIHRLTPPFKIWRGVRSGLALACFASILFSSAEMWRLNFKDFATAGEPYVYVQSTQQFKVAVDSVFAHMRRRPEDISLRVLALNRDTWPLPYLLEPLTNVTWGKAETADFTNAAVIFADGDDKALIESHLQSLQGSYFVLPFQIRDSYQDGQAYLRVENFKDDLPIGTPIVAAGGGSL